MKIRLLAPQRLVVPVGSEIDVDDSRAALLIEIGAAENAEPIIETAVADPVVETPEKKPTRKKK